MLNISSDVKAKLKSDICNKVLRITVDETECFNEDIYEDSFELTESIMDSKVEFVGCIASIMKATISTTKLPKANLQGTYVEADVAVIMDAQGTLSAYIPLFHGYIDTCETSADGHWQKIVCYDSLAYLTDTPIYNAYKAAFNGGSVTLAAFRSSIFSALQIGQDAQTLANDAVKFKKRYRNKDLTALALVRFITQINGAYGIINREDLFEYRYIDDSASPEDIPYYRSLEYDNTTIRPINTGGLTIRTNSNDAGVTVDWTNYQQYVGEDPGWNDDSQDTYLVDPDDEDITESNYVIEGNLIAYKLSKNKKKVIAANIMSDIGHDAVFRPYKVVCNGLPYVECGDKVRFTKADTTQIGFVVTKRTLKGVQNMTDTYECQPSQEVPTDTGGSGGADASKASYVSNILGNTASMGPDDALLNLIEKDITQNGTYAAIDDGAEGYSQVNVNVPGGGTELHPNKYQAEALEDLYEGDLITMIHSRVIGDETAVEVNTSLPANASIATNDEYIFYSTGTDVYRIPIDDLDATPELWKSYSGNVSCFWKYIFCSSEHLVETTNGGSVTGVSSIDTSAMTAGGVPAYMVNGDKGVITPEGAYTRWGVSETGMNPGYPISGSSSFVNAGIYHVIRPASYEGGVETYIWHGTSPNYWYLDVPLTIRDNTVYFCINGNLAKMGVRGSTYTVVKAGNYSYPKVGVGDAEFTPVWWDTPDGLTTSNNRRWTNVLNLSNIAVCFSHYCWTGSQMWDLDPQPLPKRMYKNYADRNPAIPDGESLVGIGYVDHFIAEGETDEGLILFF